MQENNPKTIVITRTDKIGDLVLSIPSFYMIRKMYKNSRLVVLVRKYNYDIVKNLEYIDRVIKIDSDGISAYAIDQYYYTLFSTDIAIRNVYNLAKVEEVWKLTLWSMALVPENEDLAVIVKAVAPVEEPEEE